MSKPKVYLAGKITGDAGYMDRFATARAKLKAEGYIVLDPSKLPRGMSNADYMRICFAMIDVADAVAFIDNFASSDGAMLELQYCKYIGKTAFMVSTT